MEKPWFEVEHYIGGEFVGGGNGFDVRYPATNEVIGTAPEGKEAEVDAAVGAAQEAFGKWGRMGAGERRLMLKRFAEGIRARADELARVESWDVGRPIRENTHGYVLRVAANIEFFADFVVTHGSDAYPMDTGYINYVLHQPVGVAGLITPWNVPMMLSTWKIGPALAFGNTVVLKPAELTPIGAWKLAQIAHESGLPPGVFNVVQGFGPDSAGAYLTAHPDVDLISFTGETTTGKAIMKSATDTLKRVSAEMGGKGPNVIFADADVDKAVQTSLRSSFFNQGEFCLAGSRIMVQRPLYEEFLEKFAAAAKGLKPGDPFDESTSLGSLIGPEHLEKVEGFLNGRSPAFHSGAEVRLGGDRPDLGAPFDGGNYLNATIVADVKPEDRISQEEVFGPVATAMPFDEEDEAISLANGVSYGLSAVVQTRDLGRAVRVAGAIDAGTVWVNDFFVRDLRVPFGGMKSSGMGREGGVYSREFFTEAKTVCLSNK
ncbi:aldehyde dehydrogenase family protein [Rubrobacter marinus]|uniref:Aldehyde dehydrogenase family protein n=1 Tax=Rubrobacter marinus TaxID=2653852 RepID=A0A6G8Q0K0_9ACTN|nr:aldehyde dehydrogenase [Rubrobacter marinus]QIN79992.1 aldehyde dehydrogenase family protein [Rubrobacter marinus]